MNLRNIHYLKYRISIIITLLITFMLIACKNENSVNSKHQEHISNNDSINNYYDKLYNITKKEFNKDIDKYDYIFFFNNRGCIPCNKYFFRKLNKYEFSKNVLIIYSGGKHSFNYHEINMFKDNQIIDEYMIYRDLGYLSVSSIIKLTNSSIDTIYNVDATFKEFDSIISKFITGIKTDKTKSAKNSINKP